MDDIGERIERDFTYHAPKEGQQEKYNSIRRAHLSLAYAIVDNAPLGRERSLALTRLEESVMWANAAISRNE